MLLGLAVCSCEEKEKETVVPPYMDVTPEAITEVAQGEGDGILISIRSNVSWTVSTEDASGSPVNWIVFDTTAGEGDADILCFVLCGSRDDGRSCKIVISSTDGKFVKSLEIRQGKYIPVLSTVLLEDVLKAASSQEAGKPEQMTDFTQAKVEVIGAPGANLPDGSLFIAGEGSAWARVKTGSASEFHEGDVVLLDFTESTITRESTGAYTIDLIQKPQLQSSGSFSVAPKYISSSAIAGYENMLVELRNVQAPEGAVGSSWSGDVSLLATDENDKPFSVYVNSGAQFGSVGSGSGAVRGIVVDGKLHPRSAEDVSGLTAPRIPSHDANKITPVINVIKLGDANNTLANGTISGKTKLTFTDAPGYSVEGAAIEKVGGGSGNKMAIAATTLTAPYNSCFTTVQWNLEGTYLLYTIPVRQKISGDLEFAFAMSCGKDGVFTDVWTVSWSRDGVNYKPVDAVYCTDAYTTSAAAGATYRLTNTNLLNNRQVAEFSIPENEALTSGNLYIKLIHPAVDESWASRTLRTNCGSVLSSRTTNTPRIPYDNVLMMENFESCLYGHNPVIGIPTYHFTSFNALDSATAYSSLEGWSVTGNSLACRGCLRLSAGSGENYICSPKLNELKVPADITVTFRAAPFVDATGAELAVHQNSIRVAVNGSGTVGEIQWEGEYTPYEWHTATVKIYGAASNTQVMIGNIDGASESQCYIDDIIISR